jgi:hypothetical protein
VSEQQTDAGIKYKVIVEQGEETRTIWRYGADLDPMILKGFKAGQRPRRLKARGMR